MPLSSFRSIERLLGAAHPAVYRVTYRCSCGSDHVGLVSHDDLLATGGTAKAKVDLVERLGGEVVGLLFVVELTFLNGREKLAGHNVHSLIEYDSP